MNPISLLIASLSLCTIATAQNASETHDGFFLAFGLGAGPAYSETEISEDFGTITNAGMGTSFDFRIGSAITEDFILHATLLGDGMTDPKTTMPNGTSGTLFKELGLSILGAGFTKYVMPANIFVSATGGLAQITVQSKNSSELQKIDAKGIGLQLKAGKEWWVSSNWALGFAVDFEYASIKSDDYRLGTYIVNETDTYRNIGFQFSATFQ